MHNTHASPKRMLLLFSILAAFLVFQNVLTINVQSYRKYNRRYLNNEADKLLFDFFINNFPDGRKYDSSEFKKKYLLDTLKTNIPRQEFKSLLRQQTSEPTFSPPMRYNKDYLSRIVESELKYALAKKSSALFDRPTLQKQGKHEFLVIHPGDLDPFVTVIPNDIYYNHEKTCVNWLEDCNAQGIRSRLLQKLKSPYV